MTRNASAQPPLWLVLYAPDVVGKLVEKLMSDGKQEEARSIRAWAHSHPGMKCFWSQTDDATCRRLVSDYLVSIVVSSGYEVRCRIDLGGIVPAINPLRRQRPVRRPASAAYMASDVRHANNRARPSSSST